MIVATILFLYALMVYSWCKAAACGDERWADASPGKAPRSLQAGPMASARRIEPAGLAARYKMDRGPSGNH